MELTSDEQEQKRFAATDLATRIRYLREEVHRGAGRMREELVGKEQELVGLFQAETPETAKFVDFLVRDQAENRKNPSNWMFCKRTVRVLNPHAGPEATETFPVNLIMSDQPLENLTDAGVSEPLRV